MESPISEKPPKVFFGSASENLVPSPERARKDEAGFASLRRNSLESVGRNDPLQLSRRCVESLGARGIMPVQSSRPKPKLASRQETNFRVSRRSNPSNEKFKRPNLKTQKRSEKPPLHSLRQGEGSTPLSQSFPRAAKRNENVSKSENSQRRKRSRC